ncbi:hypothetical protein [Maridesulfovibrio sp.]|uniref:hypothetical protein n=1 Tax=Maridesulfovibrio sp. TaxID=2795000 RepID=UPI002A18CC91|nr:hypothetical protein [Maridesulfovibrio sp.]
MTEDKELLLNQYKMLCDLHKFYLNMVLTSAFFVNAIMSGVAVYIIENKDKNEYLIWALLFPIFISLSYSLILFRAQPKCIDFKCALDTIVKKIDVGVGPHVDLTIDSIGIFKYLYLASSFGLFVFLLA